jgi:uncharacterized protein YjbJ (UPF0337 family)
MELKRFRICKFWNGTAARALSKRAHPKNYKEQLMDKDRVQGSFEQAKGKVKEETGKVTGDAKLETEGKAEKTAGKVQNTVGGIKDSAKETTE